MERFGSRYYYRRRNKRHDRHLADHDAYKLSGVRFKAQGVVAYTPQRNGCGIGCIGSKKVAYLSKQLFASVLRV